MASAPKNGRASGGRVSRVMQRVANSSIGQGVRRMLGGVNRRDRR